MDLECLGTINLLIVYDRLISSLAFAIEAWIIIEDRTFISQAPIVAVSFKLY